MKTLLFISVFAIILSLTVVSIPDAEAGRTFNLNKTTCVKPLNGTWEGSPIESKTSGTCTISGSSILKAGVTMNIPSTVTLVITGTLTNDGTITINSPISGPGIINDGIINNSNNL